MGIVYDESLVNLFCHISDWVIDSGASFFITAHHDYFTFYISGDYGHVRMGNEGVSKIVSIKYICLEIIIDCKLLLKDAKHVYDICLNLIFRCKLNDDGYTNQFSEGKWKLTKDFLMLIKGRKVNTLDVIEAKIKK